jgi:iron complex outermembrane recepter protein
VRGGAVLVSPVDANYNPAGAFLNDHRFTFMTGFDRRWGQEWHWYTTASASHARQDFFRGFLLDFVPPPENAHGFREQLNLTDVYFDTHWTRRYPRGVTFVFGTDYLHGSGRAQGADFDYDVPLTGEAVNILSPADLDFHIDDDRDFIGPYAQVEWSPFERLRIDAGGRLNITRERKTVNDQGAAEMESGSQANVRGGANVGAIFTAWQSGQDDLHLFATYRDTFKPAAIDFGIGEDEGEGKFILEPETARSVEGGMKARFFDRRVELEASAFLMNFENLVMAVDNGGVPALINGGKSRFQGFEAGGAYFFRSDLTARASYSYHDAHFTDFVQDFGSGNQQLGGNRLEMSANHLASFGVMYAPVKGFLGGVSVNYTGDRFLNKRNTALAGGFATVDLSAGYRTRKWELRVDARNLADARDPVAESELGDAQYYLMTPRRVDATFRIHF